jgi:hypothetical protein
MDSAVTMLLFGSLFIGWLFLMRWLSGWVQLETRFKCSKDGLNGQISRGSFRWVTCPIRFTRLILAIELYPAFLWLSPGFPLNVVMKAICIPWDEVDRTVMKRTLLGTKVAIYLTEGHFPLRVYEEAGKRVHAVVQAKKNTSSTSHNSTLNSDARQQPRPV